MTKQEQEQAFNRRVKQNKGGAVGEVALSADEQTSGQTQPTQPKKSFTIDTEADMGEEAKASTLVDTNAASE